MKKTEVFIMIVVVASIGAIFGAAFIAGSKEEDRSDCFKWNQEAVTFRTSYYVDQLQKDQCDYLNIKLTAPVK